MLVVDVFSILLKSLIRRSRIGGLLYGIR